MSDTDGVESDLVDRLAGIVPGSPLAALRAERADVARHTEGAAAALMEPPDPGGISLAERAAIARDVAFHHQDAGLSDHYAGLVWQRGGVSTGTRWRAIKSHVATVTRMPGTATPGHIAQLREAGLSERDIVTVAQIVAFVSYQARVVAGLRLMETPHA